VVPGRPAAGGHNHNRLDAIMTTQPTDLYAILGLNRHATQAQISHAYRSLLRRYHPDTRTTPGDPSQDAVSDAALQQVLTAYAVLRDPGRRADRLRPAVRHATSTHATVTHHCRS
jgi:preprotein translocase subunit Sec63